MFVRHKMGTVEGEWWGLWQMYHRQVFMKGTTTQIQPIAQRRKMSLNVFSLEDCDEKPEIQIFI